MTDGWEARTDFTCSMILFEENLEVVNMNFSIQSSVTEDIRVDMLPTPGKASASVSVSPVGMRISQGVG